MYASNLRRRHRQRGANLGQRTMQPEALKELIEGKVRRRAAFGGG
jgi:hypothetical protein